MTIKSSGRLISLVQSPRATRGAPRDDSGSLDPSADQQAPSEPARALDHQRAPRVVCPGPCPRRRRSSVLHPVRLVSVLAVAIAALLTSVAASALGVELPSRPSTGSLPKGTPPAPARDSLAPEALHDLARGARGAEVRVLQRALVREGARLPVDGSYGPATRRAVADLQQRLGLEATGIATVALLRRLGIASLPSGHGVPQGVVAGARYLRAFPMGGDEYEYADTWGAARAQGGHQGTDILAPRGAPVRSATYGVVDRLSRVETSIGGIWVWIRDPDGNTYYYAHLQSIAPGLAVGSELWPGRIIGANGNSGDARYGVTHVHFEIHPGGGGAVPSYAELVAVDPLRRGDAARG